MPDALSQLVDALIASTVAGEVDWEQADSRGRAFIARRASGTVTLSGAPSQTLLGPGTTVKLVVKDAAGKTVEEHEAAPPDPLSGAGLLSGGLRSVNSDVLSLYERVHEQITQAKATMRSLASEFTPK